MHVRLHKVVPEICINLFLPPSSKDTTRVNDPTVGIEPIKTVSDYKATLKEIESLMSSALGTPEGNRLSMKVTKFVLSSI